MKLHEFHQKYANTPLKERFNVLDFKELGMMTLNDVYQEVKKIEDKIRPDEIRIGKLLSAVEWYLIQKEESK